MNGGETLWGPILAFVGIAALVAAWVILEHARDWWRANRRELADMEWRRQCAAARSWVRR